MDEYFDSEMIPKVRPSGTVLQFGGRLVYWLARVWLVFAGMFLLMGVVVSYLVMPGLFFERHPIPSLLFRILPVAIGFGLSLTFILPNRWTLRGWKYGARMAVSCVLACLFTIMGLGGIISGLGGGRHPAIVPVGIVLLLTAACLPGCLWWRSWDSVREIPSKYKIS